MIEAPDEDRLQGVWERTAPVRAAIASTWPDGEPGPNVEDYTSMTLDRCRTARDTGAIPGAWSTGEQLLVALVLGDEMHLRRLGFTAQDAHERVFGDLRVAMKPREYLVWLNDLQAGV